MDLKLPGSYDWIGFGLSVLVFFIFSRADLTQLQMCTYFVCIGIRIDFKMMWRGIEKVHSGTLAVGSLAS